MRRLLEELKYQHTEGQFSYSVVIADNDNSESAREVALSFAKTSAFPVNYCVEPRQNIAMARNKAIQHAEGNFIAFIDDDEFPCRDWLLLLFKTCKQNRIDGVLGPVRPYFDQPPPGWAVNGRFFERPSYRTGYRLKWSETRTGNALFRRSILNSTLEPFRSKFDVAGEDVDFFRRMMDKGHQFVWCDEAAVYEYVPPWRCNKRYLLKRALLRGSNFSKQSARRKINLAKSCVAAPIYIFALPMLFLLNQNLFFNYLIRLLDHVSRIASFMGCKMLRGRPP